MSPPASAEGVGRGTPRSVANGSHQGRRRPGLPLRPSAIAAIVPESAGRHAAHPPPRAARPGYRHRNDDETPVPDAMPGAMGIADARTEPSDGAGPWSGDSTRSQAGPDGVRDRAAAIGAGPRCRGDASRASGVVAGRADLRTDGSGRPRGQRPGWCPSGPSAAQAGRPRGGMRPSPPVTGSGNRPVGGSESAGPRDRHSPTRSPAPADRRSREWLFP